MTNPLFGEEQRTAAKPAGAESPGTTRWTRRRVLWTTLPSVVALMVVAWFVVPASWYLLDDTDPQIDLDPTNPGSVAAVFVRRYATHDPAACDLVIAQLRTALQRDGRCTGSVTATTPTIVELLSRTCGSRHGYSAAVTPAGAVGEPYLSLGLERLGTGWVVRSVLPIADRAVIRDYACATPTTSGGG